LPVDEKRVLEIRTHLGVESVSEFEALYSSPTKRRKRRRKKK